MDKEVVVAGAGFAGLSTALKLSSKGFNVKMIDQKGFHLFRPGLIPFIGERLSEEKLKIDLASFLEGTGIEFSREKIIHIDPEKDVVETNSGAHQYDYLVLALGSDVYTVGFDEDYLESVYSFSQAKKVKEQLPDVEKVAVVGAGHTGIETAAELDRKGKNVTLIGGETRPASRSPIKLSEAVLDYFNQEDIGFRGGSQVVDIDEGFLEMDDGQKIDTEMVIWTGGIQASEVVRNSFGTGRQGIKVNPGLCSPEFGNIFAAGDCADHNYTKTARNAWHQSDVIAENISKSETETLEHFEPDKTLLHISLGKEGLIQRGKKVYRLSVLRYLESLIRIRYFYSLKMQRLKLKLM